MKKTEQVALSILFLPLKKTEQIALSARFCRHKVKKIYRVIKAKKIAAKKIQKFILCVATSARARAGAGKSWSKAWFAVRSGAGSNSGLA